MNQPITHNTMQKITLIGNLAADAVQVKKKNDELFVSFSIACREKRGESESVTYYETSYRNDGAFQYLKQGKKVYVEGTPEVRAYLNKEGQPVGSVVVRVHTLELL